MGADACNELSEFYYINKRKRLFWHGRSAIAGCRIRDKSRHNAAREMASNMRAFLIDDREFRDVFKETKDRLESEDARLIKEHAVGSMMNSGATREEAEKNVGLFVLGMTPSDIRRVLLLFKNASARVLGYEKELFYLKCYMMGIQPWFALRICYHADFPPEYAGEPLSFWDLIGRMNWLRLP